MRLTNDEYSELLALHREVMTLGLDANAGTALLAARHKLDAFLAKRRA